MATLIWYVHHAPKKMPAYKPVGEDRTEQSDAVAQEKVRGYLMALAMKGKKAKG